MTVYITQENRRWDYTPAEQFGDVEFVTGSEYSNMTNSPSNARIRTEIAEMSSNFEPSQDYILQSGDPIIFAMTYNALIVKFGSVQVLKYDRRHNVYLPYQMGNTLSER